MKPTATCLILCIVCLACQPAWAVSFTDGNILVSSGDSVYEYTPAGVYVQEIAVPELTAIGAGPRDLIVHPSGDLLVFNGTFTPSLSTYDPVADTWTHESFDQWNTYAVDAYGGIATNGRYVYVPDVGNGISDPGGVVRFDRQGGPTIRSSVSRDAFDVALGLDGLIYTLSPTGSPSGTRVSAFDPDSLDHLHDVYIGSDHKGLAVDSDGSMFVVVTGGKLRHLDAAGGILDELTLPNAGTLTSSHQDVDLFPDGSILVGQRWGSVVQTDRDFSFATAFQGPSTMPNFVAFATPVPEPSTLILLGLGGLGLALFRRASA